LKNKVVIITGCNTGLGKATAKRLAELGATIVMANRNEIKTEPVLTEFRQKFGEKNIDFI